MYLNLNGIGPTSIEGVLKVCDNINLHKQLMKHTSGFNTDNRHTALFDCVGSCTDLKSTQMFTNTKEHKNRQ